MKVLTAAQMREVDRLTIEGGIPSLVLMENAARRVVEAIEREFPPLEAQHVVVFCGRGNNGGDGLAVARQLLTGSRTTDRTGTLENRVFASAGAPPVASCALLPKAASVDVVLAAQPEELSADAAANYKKLSAAGGRVSFEIEPRMHSATLVIDALLGTGLRGPVEGKYREWIRAINEDFPRAKIVSVDVPSGMLVRADLTVTFTAPKPELVLGDLAGRWIVGDIGSPPELIQSDLEISEARDFARLFVPRKRDSHKGDFGHVLVVGGAEGKTGAAAMAGLAALRAGAGLVTVACADSSRLAPELMSASLDDFTLDRMTVVAVGPGLGSEPDLVKKLMKAAAVPMVIDADGLNSIAGTDFRGRGTQTILTPHPGEMARLTGARVEDRLETARSFAQKRDLCVVLKGYRTLIAFPDGRVWINPTGTPAMATGGTGDVLTGMIAGMVAQFPNDIETAVRAAVWLHGRAGQIGAAELTEQCLIATDLLRYLPAAIRDCSATTK